MSLTGSGPDDPQRVGVPIGDLLAGMYGAYGVRRRAARAIERPEPGASSVRRCWQQSSACTRSRARGTRSPARSARPRAIIIRRSRRTGCSTALTVRCRSRSGSEGLWERFCAAFELDTDGLATNADRVAHRDRLIAVVEAAFAEWTGAELLAKLARGRHTGRDGCAASTRSTSGSRPPVRVCLVDVEHATLGTLRLPGPPLRFFTGERRRRRVASIVRRPRLDEHGRGDPSSGLIDMSARGLIDAVLDPDPSSWDRPVCADDAYQEQLRRLPSGPGRTRRCITGRGSVQGRPVAVLVSEFAFLAGSIGRVAAERITAAVRRATAERLPIVASTASGGTRMQEGAAAFLEMITISKALMDHKAAGLPYLVHLRHPTTGGVFASWGSLGHVTVAEPGALIGFLGPKVYEALHHEPFPSDVQTAENLAAHGVIDGVVETSDLPFLLDRALGVLVDPPVAPTLPRRTGAAGPVDAWTSVLRTRQPDRAGVRELLRYGATGTLRLTEPDASRPRRTDSTRRPAVRAGRPGPYPDQADGSGRVTPGASRDEPRADLGLPLVTVIDTPAPNSPAPPRKAAWPARSRCASRR